MEVIDEIKAGIAALDLSNPASKLLVVTLPPSVPQGAADKLGDYLGTLGVRSIVVPNGSSVDHQELRPKVLVRPGSQGREYTYPDWADGAEKGWAVNAEEDLERRVLMPGYELEIFVRKIEGKFVLSLSEPTAGTNPIMIPCRDAEQAFDIAKSMIDRLST